MALSGGTQPSLRTGPGLALARSQMPCELIDQVVSGGNELGRVVYKACGWTGGMFRKQKSRNSEFICEDRRKYSLPSSSMAYSPSPTKARPLTQSVHDQDVLGMHLPWLSSSSPLVPMSTSTRQGDRVMSL